LIASFISQAMFQSHNGAIAAVLASFNHLPPPVVSIPQWCDCCCPTISPCRISLAVSIPQWCDCCALPSLTTM